MGFSKIKGPLTSRIGRKVTFGPPMDVKLKGGLAGVGKIIDEVWADPTMNLSRPRKQTKKAHWGDYSFCAQLIEWEWGARAIRLAYYRRRAGEDWWEFASQMTISSDCAAIKSLLRKTLSKRKWFSSPSKKRTK